MKKGSVQLHESILVTFFVLIIIALGLVVFYRFTLNSVSGYEQEYREQQLLSSLITLPNYFSYTYLGSSQNAIDTSKLFYNNLDYGFKTILIRQTYPISSEEITCNLQNYPDCNFYVVYNKTNYKLKNTFAESMPVSLYYPLDNQYRMGKLTIYLYY